MFIREVTDFIIQEYSQTIIDNPSDFPYTSHHYVFLPEKKLVFHLISLNNTQTLDFLVLTEWFLKENIKIIHLWEDVWLSKTKIVKSRIESLLGKSKTIPARLTKLRRIDKPTLDVFLNENHLQGTTNAKLKYGLFLPKKYFRILENEPDNEELLVAVASFSNGRNVVRENIKFRSYEMIRFANLCGFTVVGGFNKIIKGFIEEHKPDDIMTYADRDWSDGGSYEKLGFERIGETPPQLFYYDALEQKRIYSETGDIRVCNINIWNTGNLKYLMKLR